MRQRSCAKDGDEPSGNPGDKIVKSTESIFADIDAAFDGIPRPANDDLLHPNCFDDNEIVALYDVRDWRDLSDATVENEYAALAFLSPGGFRFFVPAYMSLALRKPDCGIAAVESTLMSLSPLNDSSFIPSKFIDFDSNQSAVVVSFLEAMAGFADVTEALVYWRNRTNGP